MPRFFTLPIAGDAATLTGEDAHHIAKVLRMREGEVLTLCDQQGFDYQCELTVVSPDGVDLRVLAKIPCETEPSVRIRLYQALPKGEKLEFIVQKAVELGVAEIVPVLTSRCVSRPDSKSMAKKVARMQKIAAEAAKQSGRGMIPRVLPLQSFGEAVGGMKAYPCAILLYERAETPLRQLIRPEAGELAVMVGSEGGFSPEEAAQAAEAGIALASLGKRILRCETAPICALSAILFACGEF